MPIYVVGPGETYATIAAALGAIAALPQPLTEVHQVEVKEGAPLESVVIPAAISPTASGQLHIVNHELDFPEVDDVTLDKPHVKFSGFRVKGDVNAGENGQLFSENICEGKVLFLGDGATPWNIRIYNNVFAPKDMDGLVVRNIPGLVRILYNTCFVRTDGADPFYGLVVEESDVEAKFNILTAMGLSPFARCVRLKNVTGKFVDFIRNLYFTYQDATFGRYEDGIGGGDVGSLVAWQATTGIDMESLFVDPQFKCIDEAEGFDLDVANSSPAIAQGDWDPDVIIDVQKTRRPQTTAAPFASTTLGAYEEAQIITVNGKIRVLELIGGLNLNSVTHVGVGQKGTISAAEFLKPETPSVFDTDLKDRIFLRTIKNRFVVDITAKFECELGPTPAMTEALLDMNIHELEEIGLFTTDGILFMRRTVYQLPFDPLSVLTTTFIFGVSLGPCKDIVASPLVLTLTAEAV